MIKPCFPFLSITWFDIIYFAVFSSHLSVTLKLSSERAMEGDTLQAVCDVHNEEQKRFLLVWVRRTPIDNHEVEIATNHFVNDNFKQCGRYESSFELVTANDYRHVLFRLNITSKFTIIMTNLIYLNRGCWKSLLFCSFIVQTLLISGVLCRVDELWEVDVGSSLLDLILNWS